MFRLPGERARSSPLAFGDVTFAVAVLDDYQDVARSFGPWDVLDADVTAFQDHVGGVEALAARLAPFDVVVAMRERTPFGADLLARLPRLRLLITTGMANASIDIAAAKALANAAEFANEGDVVRVLDGTYELADRLDLLDGGVTLEPAAAGTRPVIRLDDDAAPAVLVSDPDANPAPVTIRGFHNREHVRRDRLRRASRAAGQRPRRHR